MNERTPIIDVTPIKQSSTRLHPQNAGGGAQSASYGQTQPGSSGGGERVARGPSGILGGVMRIGIGAGLLAIGLPMLVLPGPGLLTMTAGALLIASGLGQMRRQG